METKADTIIIFTFLNSSLSHSKSISEMFKAYVFFLFFDNILRFAGSLINLKLHIPSRRLGGSQVRGNLIAKNLGVSFGISSVTLVNHYKDNGL